MNLVVNDLPATIRETKRQLKAQLPNLRKVFAAIEDHMRREVDAIVARRERGETMISIIA